ncbi:hypothetical protein QDR37_03640 [Amnibacterium sp. CER49]|uniref:hypothetical protein n=1 Tax=Amnibacterium sp. CER49 TaxID=3039161 RepID=UPI00244A5F2A|nr:hypothetical protein [Amnibacterium sp. CER49]MDH2443033.1 hypothetical protein [Amnibacterium sp. CER49]
MPRSGSSASVRSRHAAPRPKRRGPLLLPVGVFATVAIGVTGVLTSTSANAFAPGPIRAILQTIHSPLVVKAPKGSDDAAEGEQEEGRHSGTTVARSGKHAGPVRAPASTTASAAGTPSTSASSSASSTPSASTGAPSSPAVQPPGVGTGVASTGTLTDAQLIDSIGVNIHPNYTDTTYVQNGSAQVTLNALQDLGIKNVRTRIMTSATPAATSFVNGLAASGIKLDAVVGTPDGRWSTYSTGQSAQLVQAVTNGMYKGKVAQLEMPNEWDANGGSTWASDLQRFDAEYGRALAPTGIPVLGPSMAQPGSYAGFRSAILGEARNIHPYAGTRLPEADSVIGAWSADSTHSSTGSTLQATELGWHDALNTRGGVTEAQQAPYLIRALLWNRTHGVSRSYIYELFDQRPEPAMTNREMHFGLVAVSGDAVVPGTWKQRAKPSYIQLKGLIGRLQDSGTTAGAPVQYSLSGQPSDVYSMPIARADGSTDIAIWRMEALAADGSSPSATATVKLGVPASVEAYDTATGRTSTLSSSATSSVTLPVDGSVTILRVKP